MSKNTPIPISFLWHPSHFFALGLGSGLPRFMPGTWGTVAGLALYLLVYLVFGSIDWWIHALAVALSFLVGIYLCEKTANDLGVHDHGGIVWDEFVGIWLTVLLVPITWYWLLSAFLLFRFFDIVKPWPIAWADKKVSGGLGIMLDDMIAAVYAWLVLQGLLALFS